MQTIARSELLQQLESISPGLSPRDIIEQSSCFVFNDGEVMTYNDEIACRVKTNIKLMGAVQAKPLLAVLEKLAEDEIELATNDAELLVIGKRRKAGIRMENEVLLPIDNVEKPGKFRPLHENFIDAVTMVVECTGKDESKFWTTCVHLHPKWVEACDNFQITRYKLLTGVKESTLVRGTSIKYIVNLEMVEFNETETWIHFRNKAGLILSCRRYIESYPSKDLGKLLDVTGTKTVLPKGLAEATDRANIFSEENTDNNQVLVELRPGKLKVRGEGVSGWYSEIKKLKYKGPALDFLIAPNLLVELTKRHNECEIAEDRLRVNGGNWCYATILEKAGEEKDVEEEKQDDEANDD